MLVRSPNDTRKPQGLFEAHIDEVSIRIQNPVRKTGNAIDVPVWKGLALGNFSVNVWGEELIIYVDGKKAGSGYVMQNPPHCNNNLSKKQRLLTNEEVWIRLEDEETHEKLKKAEKEIIAVFSKKMKCNKSYCIGPGLDNRISWYVLNKVIQDLPSSFTPFLIQLSTLEEVGKSVPLYDDCKSLQYFICLDTDVAENKNIQPFKGCVIYAKNKNSNIYKWFSKQKYTQTDVSAIGGTNYDLYSSCINNSILLTIPLVGMHSANEQIYKNNVVKAIKMIDEFIKLKTSIK